MQRFTIQGFQPAVASEKAVIYWFLERFACQCRIDSQVIDS